MSKTFNNSQANAVLISPAKEDIERQSNASKSRNSDFCVRSKTSVGNKREHKKRGRKKKGYSMGKYPFLSAALRYLEDQKPFLAETTLKERERKFRHLNKEFVKLWKAGKLSTTNPKRLTEKDIGAILLWMQERGLDPRTQEKYIGFLTRVVRHGGNPVIDRMREKGFRLPRDIPKEIRTLSEEEIHRIQQDAEKINSWYGDILRFITAVYPYTGLRPGELRLAQVEDLNTDNWTIWVRHPKGEGKYARQRTVTIPPPARPYVQEYLTARAQQLKLHKISECEQLIPNFTKSGTGYYSDGGFRRLKYLLEKAAGINFKLKDFRSSYAQNLKDRGVSIEAVSKALGHGSTKTTEKYYARIRDASVFEEINRAWERPKNESPFFHDDKPDGAKKPQMKKENWLSGYA